MTKLQKKHPPGGQAGWAKKPETYTQLERDKSTAVALALQGRVSTGPGTWRSAGEIARVIVERISVRAAGE